MRPYHVARSTVAEVAVQADSAEESVVGAEQVVRAQRVGRMLEHRWSVVIGGHLVVFD